MPICFLYVSCSSITPPPPPPPTEGNGNSEATGGGGGVKKEAIYEGVGDCLQRFFSRGSW